MAQYRVSKDGVRIIPTNGAPYHLPPGTVLDELPDRYEGKLEVIVDTKQEHYQNKVIRPAEDKSL